MSVVRWGCSMTTRSNWIGSPHDGSPRAPPRASPRSLRIASNTSGRREFVDRHSLGVGYRPKHGRLIADADNVGRPIAELGAGPPRLVTRALHRHGSLHQQPSCDGGRKTSPPPSLSVRYPFTFQGLHSLQPSRPFRGRRLL